jgi:hypothetical protein
MRRRSAVEDEEAVDFTKRMFGDTAIPYLLPIYTTGNFWTQYRILQADDYYMMVILTSQLMMRAK